MVRKAIIGMAFVALSEVAGVRVRAGEAEWLASFVVDPGVKMELFAAEPLVVDPVALCFSADGSCLVVEMRDYPLGLSDGSQKGGRVRRLRDTDGDGKADTSEVFADGLSYPTSITPWRNGVLVAAPPDVLFLEDTDGDGQADVRRVVATGFPLGVTDSNFNGLRLGLDGRVHGVNGGNGGRIVTPLNPGLPPVDLGRLDFSLDPDRGKVGTTVETGGGFGLVFDEWGNSFTAHNREYLMQRVAAQRYLEGIPSSRWLGPFTTFIARDGHATRLFPIGEMQTRVNHPEQAGHFSSGSVTFYFGKSPFGAEWERSILTCDQAASVIHRDELRWDGAVAVADPTNGAGREFLASRDVMFRPTALEHGPDGAVWLCDMQREVIEHPDYIGEEVKKTLNLRKGEDKGRIYRLVPAGGLPVAGKPMDAGRPEEWVISLGSPFPWRRETAHRLLLEKDSDEVRRSLERLAADDSSPVARVRAMWLLQSWGGLKAGVVNEGLNSSVPGVVRASLSLAELQPGQLVSSGVLNALRHAEPSVRLQAALSAGALGLSERMPPMLDMLRRDAGDPWLVKAGLIGLGAEAPAALEQVLSGATGVWPEAVLEPLARLAVSFGRPLPVLDRAALTSGLAAGLAAGAPPAPPEQRDEWIGRLNRWSTTSEESTRPLLFDLAGALGVPVPDGLSSELERAAGVAGDPGRPEADRVKAIRLLARGPNAEPLIPLLEATTSAGLQQAVVAALQRHRDPALGARLLERWPMVNPAVRPAFISLFVDRRPWHEALVSALERKEILFAELNLDLEQRREFLLHGDKALAERAKKFFGDHEYSNRRGGVAELLARLPERGDARAGFRLYMERCQMCHVRGAIGNAVGPELMGLNHRSTEDLLSHIVDPNMAIHPNYVACTVVAKSGERHTGLLRDDSADSVSVLMPLGSLVTVPRDQIESVTTLNRSLMPEGLDSGLLPEELKGLIEFLQSRE
jgi:putative membrane-bound dehydrogenase-like protein